MLRLQSTLRRGARTLSGMSTVDHSRDVPWLELNSDKSKSVLVNTTGIQFQETYSKGVYRKMIERLGGEVARCTTVVKYDPERKFPRHTHSGGEEFFVLEGVWRDDYGVFPKYSYIRNYIGSGHTPEIGEEGCMIIVKLRQMAAEHKEPDHVNVDASPESEGWELKSGGNVKELYSSPYERVSAQVFPAGNEVSMDVPIGGKEVFVVDGSFTSALGEHGKHSWTRLTEGTALGAVKAGTSEPLFLYVKEGHLASPEISVDLSMRPKDWKPNAGM